MFGLYGGDANKSGTISNSDIDSINSDLNSTGYFNGDCNMSSIISNADKDYVNNNLNISTQVP